MLAALLLGALAFGEEKKPPLPPVTAALVEVLGPARAATLKQPPELGEVVGAFRPEEKPAGREALHPLDKSADPRVLSELARAYSLLGDDEAAMRASDRARSVATGFHVEYQHALSLARAGDHQAAYREAVALNERYPGRPELAGLIASTRDRISSRTVIERPAVSITPATGSREPTPAALAAMQRAAAARAADPAAAWAAVQEAMAADPTNPTVQELYRVAQEDRRRHRPAAGPADINLSPNGVETPARGRGRGPLWPVVPIGLLTAGGYVAIRRRQSTFASDHDFEANEYHASRAEKYAAGAVVAAVLVGSLYIGGRRLLMTSGPYVVDRMQQLKSEAGSINPVVTGAAKAPSLANLNIQMAAQEIAHGHAFAKHGAQFGVQTEQEFAAAIERVMANPTVVRQLSGGRIAYWQESSATVVIRNPRAADGGTAFIPSNGIEYFRSLR